MQATPPDDCGGKRLSVATKVLGEKTLRISELEAENAALLAQLEDLRNSGVKQKSITGLDNVTVSYDRHEALVNKYNALAKQYRDLESKHGKCDRRVEFANKKWADAKDSARLWKAYAGKKQKEKLHQNPIDVGESDPVTPMSLSDVHDNDGQDRDLTPRAPPQQNDSVKTSIMALDRDVDMAARTDLGNSEVEARGNAERAAARTSSRALRVTSSQTTEGASDPADVPSSPPVKREVSSDSEPVVVSARSLKRKRSALALAMPPPVRIKQERNSPERPIEIKSEDFSSPVHVRRHLPRVETSDLDAFAETLPTPRRRRSEQRAVSEEIHRPAKLSKSVSSLSDGGSTDAQEAFVPLGSEAQKGSIVGVVAFRQQPITPGTDQQALQPLSVNVPVDRRTDRPQRAAAKPRRSDQNAAAKAALLSEDGESQNVQPAMRSPAQQDTLESAHTSKKLRLGSLLHDPSTDRQQLARSRTPESVITRKTRPLAPPAKGSSKTSASDQPLPVRPLPHIERASRPALSSKRMSPEKARHRHAKRPPLGLEPPPPMEPEDEPLRLRPLSSLRLEDFKINPKFADSEYAFTDTVRGREARRCLPGCTRPNCCGGAFLKAVQMNAGHGSEKSNAEMLEQYFGSNWEQIVGAYPRDKREALVLEARAAAFANQYGKHRHAFERRSTPPGFWRTDMPTTQEAADDREQAHAMVRQKVEERYREAMRDRGRWLFRDE